MTEHVARVTPWRVTATRGTASIGAGRVIGVQPHIVDGRITVWTEEHWAEPPTILPGGTTVWTERNAPVVAGRRVQVVATADPVPVGGQHLGACVGSATGYTEWHVYDTTPTPTPVSVSVPRVGWLCRTLHALTGGGRS